MPGRYYDKYIKHGAIHWKYYQQKHGFYYPIIQSVVEKIPKESTVIDFGCGDGLLSHVLAKQGCQVFGFDLDATGVSLAQEQIQKHNYTFVPVFQQGDIQERNPFVGIKADVATSIDVIEHLRQPEKLLAQMSLAASRVVIGTPEPRMTGKGLEKYHVKEFTVEELTQILVTAGYRNVEVDQLVLTSRNKQKQYWIATADSY